MLVHSSTQKNRKGLVHDSVRLCHTCRLSLCYQTQRIPDKMAVLTAMFPQLSNFPS